MIKQLTTVVFLFGAMLAFAQKTDSEKVRFKYTEYPKNPLELSVKKYDFKVFNNSDQVLPSNDVIANKLKLDGFVRTSENPDAILFLIVDKIVQSTSVLPYAASKDVTNYFFTVNVTMEASVRFTTADRKYEYYVNDKFDQPLSANFKSQYYPTEAAAKDELKKYLMSNLVKQCIDNSLDVLSYYVSSNHGYSSKSEVFPVYTIEGKEFDYSDVNQAMEKYKLAMADYSTNGLTKENGKLLEESISIWVKNIESYNPDDKKARISSKNILELYMNLTLANVWLNKFEDAKKYLNLAANEKGLNGVKNAINEILLSNEQRFSSNLLREQNKIVIEKKESALYFAPDFLPTSGNYRIKYEEFYNEYNPKVLSKRRVFEYDLNGLVKKVYMQKYDPLNRTFEGESDVYRVQYDNKDKIMSFYAASSTTPESYQTLKNGKIVSKAGTGKMGSFNYSFTYNNDGLLTKITNSLSKGQYVVSNFTYVQGQLKSMVRKKSMGQDSIPDSKIDFTWQGAAIAAVDFYYNPTGGKEFAQKAYSNTYEYDATNRLIRIKGGAQVFTYKYDENGNVIDRIVNSDTTPEHRSYVWEKGSGNASLFLLDETIATENPMIYPQIK